MKIAVPTTQNNLVDAHFGHCEFYTIFTIDNNKILKAKKYFNLHKDVVVNRI